MDIFNILTLFGGLSMFLYGMRLMGDSLKESSSGTLKVAIEHVTDNPVKAFVLGFLITAVIQSSTATIVITSGLVGAGILSLHQSLGIIVGASVGTTVTGQIIRLLDVDASSGSFLRLFQPSTLAPVALIIGIICVMALNFKNSKSIGNILLGFGILFSGLLNMTEAVKGIQESPMIGTLLSGLSNPFIGYVTGAGIAFVLQSSSATIGILQAFSTSGLLTFKSIYAVIVGVYLGDCVTTAIVCSIGAEKDSQRVGIVNILFNLSKSALVLIGVTIVHQLGFLDSLWDAPANSSIIANANTIFNLACSIALLPILGIYEKTSRRIVRDAPVREDKYKNTLDELSPAFFSTPALALRSCYDVLLAMFNAARDNITKAFPLMDTFNPAVHAEILAEEKNIDRMTDSVSRYIVDLLPHLTDPYHLSIVNQYYRATNDFEHLGDFAEDIANNAEALSSAGMHLSDAAKKELQTLIELFSNLLAITGQAFEKRDVEKSYEIEALTRVAEALLLQMKENHLNRLGQGICNAYADVNYTNLLTQAERISDACSNVGAAIMVRVNPEIAAREHRYYHELHTGQDEKYNAIYEKMYAEYFGRLAE